MTEQPVKFHSRIGFSARKRWSQCPGSVPLGETMPPKPSSEYAAEGTCAHALLERCLTRNIRAGSVVGVKFFYEDHGEDKCQIVSQEMADAVDRVVERIQHVLRENPKSVLKCETRLALPSIHPDLFGTGDVVIWIPATKTLMIRDLKYGAGVSVQATEDGKVNPQLEGYALGALLTHPEWKAKEVTIVIDQPRLEPQERMVTLPVGYFLDMAEDLRDECLKVDEATQAFESLAGEQGKLAWQDKYLSPSEDGCRWCAAAPVCPKLRRTVDEAAAKVFAPGRGYDPKELAKTLDTIPLIEAWIKNTKEFALSEALADVKLPGYKLVDKLARRKWNPTTNYREVIEKLLGEEAYEPVTMKSPAAIEKLLTKEQRQLLIGLTTKESSGATLVSVDDKREEWHRDSATVVFSQQ